jgi:hypothetical protein
MSGKAARARQNADPAGYSRGAICAPSRGSVRTRPGRERHGCRGRRRRGGLGDQGAGRALRHRARAPGAVLDSGQAAVGCRGSRRPRRTSCEGAPRRPLPGSARSGALLATATRRQAARPAHPCDRQGGPVDHRHRPCGADQPAASDRTQRPDAGRLGSLTPERRQRNGSSPAVTLNTPADGRGGSRWSWSSRLPCPSSEPCSKPSCTERPKGARTTPSMHSQASLRGGAAGARVAAYG